MLDANVYFIKMLLDSLFNSLIKLAIVVDPRTFRATHVREKSLSDCLPRDKILEAIPVTSSFPEGSQFGVIVLPHDNRILVPFPTLEENPREGSP